MPTSASEAWTPPGPPDLDGARPVPDHMLIGHTARTVYFAGRPEQRVGTVPTREFLGRLGFAPTATQRRGRGPDGGRG